MLSTDQYVSSLILNGITLIIETLFFIPNAQSELITSALSKPFCIEVNESMSVVAIEEQL